MAFHLQKPPVGARLDFSQPPARGLVLAAPYFEGSGAPFNLVNMRGAISTAPSLLGWGATPAGVARTNTSSDASGAYDTFTTPAVSTSSFTIEALISASAYATASGDTGPIAGFPQLTYLSLGGNYYPNVAFAVINNAVGFQSTRTIPLDVPVLLHLTYDGSTARLYIDGTLAASLATAQTAYTETTVRTFNRGNGAIGNMIGSIMSVHVWNFPLNSAQTAERAADPWSFYRNRSVSRYFEVSPKTAVSAIDSATLVDAAIAAAGVSQNDGATLVDLAAGTAVFTRADFASLIDVAAAFAAISPVDSAAAADSASAVATLSLIDMLSLNDSAITTAILALADAATAVDTSALATFLVELESASLVDAATATAALAAVDSAGLTEVSTLALLLAAIDSAGLSEGEILNVLVSAVDSTTLADSASIAELIFGLDSAGLIDSASLNRNLPTCLVGYASFVQGAPDPRFTKVTNL